MHRARTLSAPSRSVASQPPSSHPEGTVRGAEEPDFPLSRGHEESDTTERLHFHFSCTGGGNGNPLQRSCLENPRDGGAWLAAVYGVAQSWTRLQQLSSSSSSYLPLQCSCLENPRDGGAWWAAIYGVAQSRTRLKRLSSSSHLGRASPLAPW